MPGAPPCLVAGALLTFAIARTAPESAWILPGIWQVLYSLGIFASYRLLPRATFGVALFYLLTGLVCLAVAQVLLRFDDERHWLRAAPKQVGHLFPRLLRQSEYNDRVKAASALMAAALRWLAE